MGDGGADNWGVRGDWGLASAKVFPVVPGEMGESYVADG